MTDNDDGHFGSSERETWFYRRGVMNVPCPKCGGELELGQIYDWPVELGGEYVADCIRCRQCKSEWAEFDTPDNFTDPNNSNCWNVTVDDDHR